MTPEIPETACLYCSKCQGTVSPCDGWVRDAAGQPVRCSRKGIEVRLTCPLGRPDAVACYCDEHGGQPRAQAEAEAEWNYAAPSNVGDAEAVLEAGLNCLRTPDAYIVARQLAPNLGGKWEAFLGLGSHQIQVPNPVPPRRRGRVRTDGRGGYAFDSCEAALAAADETWGERVRFSVASIRAFRGGTLDWGVPVEPLDSPIVIVLEQGDTRSAWDIATTLAPRSRSGKATLTGLRPSGECA